MSLSARADATAGRKKISMLGTSTSRWALPLFLGGLTIGLVGLFVVSAPIRSFFWEMKVQTLYVEGQCRVIRSRIGRGGDEGGLFVLYVTHQVEVDGKVCPPNESTEELDLTANSAEDLEPIRARYPIGSLQPCWYDAHDPARYSVLVRDGLHPWTTLGHAFFAAPLLVVAVLMLRRAGRSIPDDEPQRRTSRRKS